MSSSGSSSADLSRSLSSLDLDAEERSANESVSPAPKTKQKVVKKSARKVPDEKKKIKPVNVGHSKHLQMVLDAIKDLGNSKTGITYPAIKKYVMMTHNLTEKSLFYIKKGIKTAVERQLVIQVKGVGASGSFKLAKQIKVPKAIKPKMPTGKGSTPTKKLSKSSKPKPSPKKPQPKSPRAEKAKSGKKTNAEEELLSKQPKKKQKLSTPVKSKTSEKENTPKKSHKSNQSSSDSKKPKIKSIAKANPIKAKAKITNSPGRVAKAQKISKSPKSDGKTKSKKKTIK